jgi:post-segregation antitoxin (ccd killing protein)
MQTKPPRQIVKRRTTLTLPVEFLGQAEKIARARHVNLSSVVSQALADGLRQQAAKDCRDEILRNYTKAFSGFLDEELSILDGIILEPVNKTSRK